MEKWEHPDPPRTGKYGTVKLLYKITLDGQHALMVLARNKRIQEEKIKQRNNKTNGLARWNAERKILGFQIQTK